MSTTGQNKIKKHTESGLFLLIILIAGQKNIFFGNKVRRKKNSSSLRIQKHVQSPSTKKKTCTVAINCDRKHHETYDSQKILSL